MFGSIFFNIRSTAANAGSVARDARGAVEEATSSLHNRIEALELACAGLWELLKQRHGYTDDELIAAIQAVDLRDGAIDGKISAINRLCSHCKRKQLTRDSPRCSWCGADLPVKPL